MVQDGHPDTVSLFNLSKKYAAQFDVKVDDVYNTIMDIWRIRREAEAGATKSVFIQEPQVKCGGVVSGCGQWVCIVVKWL